LTLRGGAPNIAAVRTVPAIVAAAFIAGLVGAGASPRAQEGDAAAGPPKIISPLPGNDEEIPSTPRAPLRREGGPQIGPEQRSASESLAKPELSAQEARKQKLDELFGRLATSKDADETQGLIPLIDRTLLQSGSDSADFLMARAIAAMGASNLEASLALLDRLVAIAPDWAEAWNKRATVRYMKGDESGSMADIAQTIQREPRHFGALSGMGMILEQRGFNASALRAYRRVLEIAPEMAMAKAAVERLEAAEREQGL
jgi:tetratricopeptide (TPR) repeat protein